MKVKIASIREKIEQNTVYNFAVKDDESYIINGVVSHNCRCALAPASKDMGFVDETESKRDFDEWLNDENQISTTR